MSRDQHAGQNHNINISEKCLERVKQFKYLATNLTDQNPINEQIKISLQLFGAESFVFQLPKQKYKDQGIQNCKFVCNLGMCEA
jgi:hypothetical protein